MINFLKNFVLEGAAMKKVFIIDGNNFFDFKGFCKEFSNQVLSGKHQWNEETAFTLSDFYIQHLEEQESLKAILSLMEDAIYDFTNRVAELNSEKYSAKITACQHYIYNHLYDDITLEQLSDLCQLSTNYLSSFKKRGRYFNQ
ncbi:hypothetical protein J6TS2_44460 [Heyndrickxia sporothermodurans]|nr:hypothetical protein J6TS2_44460 [Heyndrickxia sporothermodurans]